MIAIKAVVAEAVTESNPGACRICVVFDAGPENTDRGTAGTVIKTLRPADKVLGSYAIQWITDNTDKIDPGDRLHAIERQCLC